MKILYSLKFGKEYKKLPDNIKDIAEQKEAIFQNNPFNLKLKTHKLKGKFRNYYSFSITYSYRIVFRFLTKNKVLFVDCGDHSIYR
ncbi:type II toxin-antitoxin system mRNA interferase toxin, RelE/StbE family [Patescibacteria group bacterium]|nr:type II toxin-antitoxin system mRNA interferase toxin, RelE/StbE family [Patescibacteria group bacterium]